MTLGSLVAFNAYLVYLSFPTIALGWILAVWQRGFAAWGRVKDLLTTPSTITDAAAFAASEAAGASTAGAGELARARRSRHYGSNGRCCASRA